MSKAKGDVCRFSTTLASFYDSATTEYDWNAWWSPKKIVPRISDRDVISPAMVKVSLVKVLLANVLAFIILTPLYTHHINGPREQCSPEAD